jgi:protein-S-isoprenylcysteine O-methyltransferase Ste14
MCTAALPRRAPANEFRQGEMDSQANHVLNSLWLLWVVSWFVAWRWSGRTVKRSQPGERILELVLALWGIGALFFQGSDSGEEVLQHPLYQPDEAVAWLLVAAAGAGFATCWWARIHLGQMWSSDIVLKENHRIVESGPYGLVRHPIYTGLLLAAWATAALHSRAVSFLGAGLLTLAFYLKASSEERLLTAELGPPYAAYRATHPHARAVSQALAARRMAARLRSTSASVVAHDDTLMRIAV